MDLEDAVAISEKEDTRRAVVDAMSQTRSCRGYIRVNSLGTQFCEDDILYVIGDKLDGIVLPKVEDAETIKRVDQLKDEKTGGGKFRNREGLGSQKRKILMAFVFAK